ncbi:lipopolysaccharide biosynthesis protein [Lactiplantibacillus plantarum]|uniref:Uncharacterized protein n=2 Tax=Lactiplantibacillus plantarum TaxID=1590 RepID=A0A1E3KQM4_LACPN|nr:oligosaccharide flippase family protein [Lactiplantibacillus plantarum]KEZ14577.1 Polysaccharide biosynthesis protein [Lactiplantibacillus plantarum]MCB7466423.1 oligosaccharide flippase family protein [Lactiplantibacillus plantarum]MCB7469472.1 oligosaccharide flippase family protein [Lactiplantibacillus plantarum]MCB7472859.1 oligosaccharide flippase family protein [Lactiplantibacillus plantarum]MCB7475358.1 oligosaccharide flippase family protein [Lactiplantibacillus plantarum]
MDQVKQLFKNTLIFGIGNIGSKLIQFIAVPMFTVFLTTKEYGEADLMTTIVSLALPFFSLCLYDAILRFIIDNPENEESIISSAIFVTGILVGVLAIIDVLLMFLKTPNIFLYRLVIIFLIVQVIQSLLAQYLKAIGKNWLYSVNGLLLSILILLFSFVFFHFDGNKIYWYFYAQISSYIISVIFVEVCLKDRTIFRLASVKKTWIKKLTEYSLPLIPNQIMWWVMNASDRLLVTYYLGLSVNGIYAIAAKIPALTNVVITIFMQAWQLSSFENANDRNRNVFFSTVFNNLLFVLTLFSSIIMTFLMPIMTVIASKAYYTAWEYVPMLLLGGIFSNISMFLGTNYLVGKNTGGIFRTSIIGAVLNVGLNIYLIPELGANGASISTLISYLVVCLIRLFETDKVIQIDIDYRLLLSAIGILIVQIICLYTHVLVLQIVFPILLILLNFKYVFNAVKMGKNIVKR